MGEHRAKMTVPLRIENNRPLIRFNTRQKLMTLSGCGATNPVLEKVAIIVKAVPTQEFCICIHSI